MRKEIYFADSDGEYSLNVEQLIGNYWPDVKLRRFERIETLYRKLVRTCDPALHQPIPSVVICNMQMPGLNGDHLLTLLKQKINGRPTRLSDLPVVIFTSPKTQQCSLAGASLVIEKPVRFNDLKLHLGAIIGHYVHPEK